jgi:formate hydrogenlyase subunit 6/NADH:ubiquinone oxidoreductase subunit I
MALEITVHEQSCRGCEMCVDICPTKVFEMDAGERVCKVRHAEDCIACLSCTFLCPSQAISHTEFHLVKNFYRDADFCSKMEKFI